MKNIIFKRNCGSNGYKIKIEREHYDENVFLKADRASSKWNFLFNLKSKTKLVIRI